MASAANTGGTFASWPMSVDGPEPDALAALGYLSPVVAGAAMALSSVSVLTNALLLKRWRLPRR